MKLKHSAVLALVLWLGVVAWVGAMIVAKPTVFGRYGADSDAASAAALQQQVVHNDEMRRALSRMAALRRGTMTEVAVAPAPSAAEAEALALAASGAAPVRTAPAHVLSLIVSSDRLQQAVIDGELVARGAQLEDGLRVRAIGTNWVRLQDAKGRTQTLTLRSPGEAEARP